MKRRCLFRHRWDEILRDWRHGTATYRCHRCGAYRTKRLSEALQVKGMT